MRVNISGHYEKLANIFRKKLETVISDFVSIHGDDFDYSLIVSYEHNKQPLPIICRKHKHKFELSYNKHFTRKQRGCKFCKSEKTSKRSLLNHSEFLIKANKKHNFEFEYLDEYTNAHFKMSIKHKKCGKIFRQTPGSHVWGNGCPFCKCSKSQKKIRDILDKRTINYESEYWFENCRGKKRPLPFDFYLPDLKCCIEFDGIQHFRPIHFRGKGKIHNSIDSTIMSDFLNIINNDLTKNHYCRMNGIKLIRIPFWDLNIAEKILVRELGL